MVQIDKDGFHQQGNKAEREKSRKEFRFEDIPVSMAGNNEKPAPLGSQPATIRLVTMLKY
jgi:hypothetical protein